MHCTYQPCQRSIKGTVHYSYKALMKIVGQVWTLQVFEYTCQETDWILLYTAPIHNTSIVAKTQDLQKCNTKKKCCLNTCILPLKRAKYHNKLKKLTSSNRIHVSNISWSFDFVLSKSSLEAKSKWAAFNKSLLKAFYNTHVSHIVWRN